MSMRDHVCAALDGLPDFGDAATGVSMDLENALVHGGARRSPASQCARARRA